MEILVEVHDIERMPYTSTHRRTQPAIVHFIVSLDYYALSKSNVVTASLLHTYTHVCMCRRETRTMHVESVCCVRASDLPLDVTYI